VRQVVKPAEDGTTAGLRHERPWLRGGHITEDPHTICEGHWLEGASQAGGLLVLLLLLCYKVEVTRVERHSKDRATQTVGDNVVTSTNVPHIHHVLGNHRPVALLAIRFRHVGTAESTHEGLVVGEEGDSPTLDDVTEVQSGQVSCEEFPVVGRVSLLWLAELPGEESDRNRLSVDDLVQDSSYSDLRGISHQLIHVALG